MSAASGAKKECLLLPPADSHGILFTTRLTQRTPGIGGETRKPLQSERPVIDSRPPHGYNDNIEDCWGNRVVCLKQNEYFH
jgi:hypothetical protein